VNGLNRLDTHFNKFGMRIHTLKQGEASTSDKTAAMFCPSQNTEYDSEDTSDFVIGNDENRRVPVVTKHIYLGFAISSSLDSECDVDRRITKANQIHGSLMVVFRRKDIGLKVKGRIYVVLVLSILLYGSECWCMKKMLMDKLRSFYHKCVRDLCGINMYHTQQHHITTTSLLARLGIHSIEHYYYSRCLSWGGHVARMSKLEMPRKLLTSWIKDVPRPTGRPFTT